MHDCSFVNSINTYNTKIGLNYVYRFSPYRAVNISRPGYKNDRQCTYECNSDARSLNHCCRGKTLSVTYSECVSVALVIEHAMCMRRIVICGLTVPYFSTLSHKNHDFREPSY